MAVEAALEVFGSTYRRLTLVLSTRKRCPLLPFLKEGTPLLFRTLLQEVMLAGCIKDCLTKTA